MPVRRCCAAREALPGRRALERWHAGRYAEKEKDFTRSTRGCSELAAQEQRLVTAMKHLEAELNDELHADVTSVLVELTAYNVMRLLHDLQAERARIAFGGR